MEQSEKEFKLKSKRYITLCDLHTLSRGQRY